jgi:hypothetical protein
MKFRKKPVVIEAFKWTGNINQEEDPIWIVQEIKNRIVAVEYPYLVIKTLEGNMNANIGDWIIKGVEGEIYPCKPDIFKKTYEEIK